MADGRVWVDLGGREAVDASLIRNLEVQPPWPPSTLRMRSFVEQLSWSVYVTTSHRNTVHLVGYYPDERRARAHARKIVGSMLEAAK